jgi:hypothetical protein
MNGRTATPAQKLTIQRVFEPHRLSAQFLAEAYERLFPMDKRPRMASNQFASRWSTLTPTGGFRHEQ